MAITLDKNQRRRLLSLPESKQKIVAASLLATSELQARAQKELAARQEAANPQKKSSWPSLLTPRGQWGAAQSIGGLIGNATRAAGNFFKDTYADLEQASGESVDAARARADARVAAGKQKPGFWTEAKVLGEANAVNIGSSVKNMLIGAGKIPLKLATHAWNAPRYFSSTFGENNAENFLKGQERQKQLDLANDVYAPENAIESVSQRVGAEVAIASASAALESANILSKAPRVVKAISVGSLEGTGELAITDSPTSALVAGGAAGALTGIFAKSGKAIEAEAAAVAEAEAAGRATKFSNEAGEIVEDTQSRISSIFDDSGESILRDAATNAEDQIVKSSYQKWIDEQVISLPGAKKSAEESAAVFDEAITKSAKEAADRVSDLRKSISELRAKKRPNLAQLRELSQLERTLGDELRRGMGYEDVSLLLKEQKKLYRDLARREASDSVVPQAAAISKIRDRINQIDEIVANGRIEALDSAYESAKSNSSLLRPSEAQDLKEMITANPSDPNILKAINNLEKRGQDFEKLLAKKEAGKELTAAEAARLRDYKKIAKVDVGSSVDFSPIIPEASFRRRYPGLTDAVEPSITRQALLDEVDSKLVNASTVAEVDSAMTTRAGVLEKSLDDAALREPGVEAAAAKKSTLFNTYSPQALTVNGVLTRIGKQLGIGDGARDLANAVAHRQQAVLYQFKEYLSLVDPKSAKNARKLINQASEWIATGKKAIVGADILDAARKVEKALDFMGESAENAGVLMADGRPFMRIKNYIPFDSSFYWSASASRRAKIVEKMAAQNGVSKEEILEFFNAAGDPKSSSVPFSGALSYGRKTNLTPMPIEGDYFDMLTKYSHGAAQQIALTEKAGMMPTSSGKYKLTKLDELTGKLSKTDRRHLTNAFYGRSGLYGTEEQLRMAKAVQESDVAAIWKEKTGRAINSVSSLVIGLKGVTCDVIGNPVRTAIDNGFGNTVGALFKTHLGADGGSLTKKGLAMMKEAGLGHSFTRFEVSKGIINDLPFYANGLNFSTRATQYLNMKAAMSKLVDFQEGVAAKIAKAKAAGKAYGVSDIITNADREMLSAQYGMPNSAIDRITDWQDADIIFGAMENTAKNIGVARLGDNALSYGQSAWKKGFFKFGNWSFSAADQFATGLQVAHLRGGKVGVAKYLAGRVAIPAYAIGSLMDYMAADDGMVEKGTLGDQKLPEKEWNKIVIAGKYLDDHIIFGDNAQPFERVARGLSLLTGIDYFLGKATGSGFGGAATHIQNLTGSVGVALGQAYNVLDAVKKWEQDGYISGDTAKKMSKVWGPARDIKKFLDMQGEKADLLEGIDNYEIFDAISRAVEKGDMDTASQIALSTTKNRQKELVKMYNAKTLMTLGEGSREWRQAVEAQNMNQSQVNATKKKAIEMMARDEGIPTHRKIHNIITEAAAKGNKNPYTILRQYYDSGSISKADMEAVYDRGFGEPSAARNPLSQQQSDQAERPSDAGTEGAPAQQEINLPDAKPGRTQCGEYVNDALGLKGNERMGDSLRSKIDSPTFISRANTTPTPGMVFVEDTGTRNGHCGVVTGVSNDGISITDYNKNNDGRRRDTFIRYDSPEYRKIVGFSGKDE